MDTFRGHTIDTLYRTFDRIRDEDDITNPISVCVADALINVTHAAIEYYTGVNAIIEYNAELGLYGIRTNGRIKLKRKFQQEIE